MPLFVDKPVGISGVFGRNAAGNDNNAAPRFYPTYKLVAVVSLIGKEQPARQIKRLQQCLCHTNIVAIPAGKQKMQWIPKPIRYRMDFRR